MLITEKAKYFYVKPEAAQIEEFRKEFPALVMQCCGKGKGPIVVDLGELNSIDSRTLGALLTGAKHAGCSGISLVLIQINESIKRLLAMTMLSSKFPVYENEAAVLNSLAAQ